MDIETNSPNLDLKIFCITHWDLETEDLYQAAKDRFGAHPSEVRDIITDLLRVR